MIAVEILKYLILSVLIFGVLAILLLAIRSRKFFKTLLINGILGILAITVIDITSKYSGVYIPVNYYTVGSSAVFGLPGVFGLLIANFIFL